MFENTGKKVLPILCGTVLIAGLTPVQSVAVETPLEPVQSSTLNRSFEKIEMPASMLGLKPKSPRKAMDILLAGLGDSATSAITAPLDGAGADCRAAGSAYEVSCLAASFRKAARVAKPNWTDYREARKILNDAAKKLDQLQKANAEKKAPKKKGKSGKYRAVKKEAVAAVRKQALKIVQETETKLLRSAGSGKRQVHYQRIAQAVGSTKVILRSS